jgi:hypothetical protein
MTSEANETDDSIRVAMDGSEFGVGTAGESEAESSTEDISSGRRGGLRSHRGAGGRTRDQLYQEAKHNGIAGRSKMTKAQLERAVDR